MPFELVDKDVEDATVRIRNEAADRLRWEHGDVSGGKVASYLLRVGSVMRRECGGMKAKCQDRRESDL